MEGRKWVGKAIKTSGTTKKERERPRKGGKGVGKPGTAAEGREAVGIREIGKKAGKFSKIEKSRLG